MARRTQIMLRKNVLVSGGRCQIMVLGSCHSVHGGWVIVTEQCEIYESLFSFTVLYCTVCYKMSWMT